MQTAKANEALRKLNLYSMARYVDNYDVKLRSIIENKFETIC